VIRQFAASTSDRSIAKFDLSAIPSTDTITGVQFAFQTTSFTTNPGRVVDILGFNTVGAGHIWPTPRSRQGRWAHTTAPPGGPRHPIGQPIAIGPRRAPGQFPRSSDFGCKAMPSR